MKYYKSKQIPGSELILNQDGSIYHLKLKPEHIADTIIIVGDPHRVEMVSAYFDQIEHKIQNREFTTHTGRISKMRLSVMSTGIGTDNIDIALNELDAIVNIDLQTRQVKKQLKVLNIIRLGTSGALQEDIPVDSIVFSKYGLGFDGLLNFYNEEVIADPEGVVNQIKETLDKPVSPQQGDGRRAVPEHRGSLPTGEGWGGAMTEAFIKHTGWNEKLAKPYIVKASDKLTKQIGEGLMKGITATAPGFYGPQGRVLRLALAYPELNEKFTTFNYKGERITNFEMETSALYGLGSLLGHETCTVCAIIANRIRKEYSKDYISTVDKMIKMVLDKII